MIKFQGEISQKCRKFLSNWETLSGRIAGIAVGGVGCVVAILWGVFSNIYALLFLVPMLMVMIFSGWSDKKIKTREPKSVTIYNDSIEMESDTKNELRYLDMVKSIKDYGEWYAFKFFLPNKSGYFICQKDLIVEGTIEDFEKLFEGKIVRKYK